ncbi:MAG: histidine ammonia-lyase [Nitrospinota bacterium]
MVAQGTGSSEVALDGENLTLEQVEAVARRGARVRIAPGAIARMERAHALVQQLVESGSTVYGVNTGFGSLSDVRMGRETLGELQLNLLRSHATGVGEPLGEAEARAVMLLRANVLAKGYSGVRPALAELLVGMLNAGLHPLIPAKGSVGASGDLIPLAHLALVLVGEGQVLRQGQVLAGGEALRAVGLSPLSLGPKEGLSLINGTQVMTALGSLAAASAERLVKSADVVGSLSLDALRGTPAAFAEELQQLRPHPGALASGRNLVRLIEGSAIRESHRHCPALQDCYSLRCMPQVHGAAREALRFARGVLAVEVNAATDNPLVFPEAGEVLSGGNFHGQPVAVALDALAVGLASLGNISERRIERLVNPTLSGLPHFLSRRSGLHSGYMLLQVTAAALASENKTLSHPASVDTIPTSGGKEDHVSMGAHAARKAVQVLENVRTILAIELLCASQGVEFLRPLRSSEALERVHAALRERVPPLVEDRASREDIATASELLESGAILAAAEDMLGPLE